VARHWGAPPTELCYKNYVVRALQQRIVPKCRTHCAGCLYLPNTVCACRTQYAPLPWVSGVSARLATVLPSPHPKSMTTRGSNCAGRGACVQTKRSGMRECSQGWHMKLPSQPSYPMAVSWLTVPTAVGLSSGCGWCVCVDYPKECSGSCS
jgi:hypothetical protein